MTGQRATTLIVTVLFAMALCGMAHAGSLTVQSGTEWRAIGPVGNNEICCGFNFSPLASWGGDWEAANPGWNDSRTYDDSAWGFAVVGQYPGTDVNPIMWVNGNGSNGDTPAYFRRIFSIPGTPTSGFLSGGVDDDALIYINGQLALDDQNGQATPFRVDVTPYLRSGENLIAIKAHDSFGFLEGIHLRVEVVYSEILPVQIDIKPGSYPNAINLSSAGVVPVAILSSSTFDATQVNPATVTLAGAGVKLIGKGDRYSCGREDVNGDGLIDLVCHVTTAQFFIEVGQSVAVLEAQTFSGRSIRGEDSIQIVP